MSILISNHGKRFHVAPFDADIDFQHPITRGLTHAWRMNEGAIGTSYDAFGKGRNIAWTSLSDIEDSPFGPAPKFNGTSSRGEVACDLSDRTQLTIAFWLWWDAFANDDDLAMEHTVNFNSNTGGFIVDPNNSGGSFSWNWRGDIGYADSTFTRPSAAAWHHYALSIDINLSTNECIAAYVDGVPQSLSHGNNSNNASSGFANSTLYLMHRNNSGSRSLFAAGRMRNLMLYSRILEQGEAVQLFLEPDCWLLREPQTIGKVAAAGGAVTLDGLIAAVAAVAGNLAVTWSPSGSVAATATIAGNLGLALPLSGAVAATGAISGNLGLVLPLSGTIAASSVVSGEIAIAKALAGSCDALTAVSGNAKIDWALSATVAAASNVAGNLTLSIPLSGTIAALSSLTGDITLDGQEALDGSINAGSIIFGNLAVSMPLAGVAASAAAVSGELAVSRPLAGVVAAAGSVAGNLMLARGLNALCVATSSVSGGAILAIGLSGSVAAQGDANALMAVAWVLTGAVTASSQLSGNLDVSPLVAFVSGVLDVWLLPRQERAWTAPRAEKAWKVGV